MLLVNRLTVTRPRVLLTNSRNIDNTDGGGGGNDKIYRVTSIPWKKKTINEYIKITVTEYFGYIYVTIKTILRDFRIFLYEAKTFLFRTYGNFRFLRLFSTQSQQTPKSRIT